MDHGRALVDPPSTNSPILQHPKGLAVECAMWSLTLELELELEVSRPNAEPSHFEHLNRSIMMHECHDELTWRFPSWSSAEFASSRSGLRDQ